MIWTLLRVFFKERFGFQRLFGRSISASPVKKLLMGLLLVYAFGVSSFSIGFLHYEWALMLVPTGQFDNLLLQMNSYMVGLAFLFSFFQARGSLYGYKDFDFLGSLPIKKTTLILAKWLLMYFFILLFGLLMTLPILIVYLQFVSLTWIGVMLGVVSFIVLPLPIMVVGVVISIGIHEITKDWFNPKIMQSILMVIFLLVYTVFQLLQRTYLDIGNMAPWLEEALSWYAPQTWVIESFQGKIISFVWLVFTHGALLSLALWGLSGIVYRLNQSQQTQRAHVSKRSAFQKRNPILHLIAMEWKRFITSPIYVLNTGFGLIMVLIGTSALIFVNDIQHTLMIIEIETGLTPQALWIIFVGFTLSTVYGPAVSLSLEGKNIQLLKSTPIPYLSISAAKILFNILLTVPMLTLSHGIVTIVFDFPFLESLLTWVLFVLLSSFFSVFFHWINVLLPRFDFQQDVEVVKQSLAALVAVLSGFALTALLATSYIVWLGQVEAIIRLLLLIGLILFGLLILTSTLKRLANRFYEGFKV